MSQESRRGCPQAPPEDRPATGNNLTETLQPVAENRLDDIAPTVGLAECEKVIERGLQAFTEVGIALITIRDDHHIARGPAGSCCVLCGKVALHLPVEHGCIPNVEPVPRAPGDAGPVEYRPIRPNRWSR